MPKNRKVVKVGDAKKVVKDSSTLRIGTRKNGTSALRMSTERLLEVLKDKNSKRDHDNARTVLRKRGAV